MALAEAARLAGFWLGNPTVSLLAARAENSRASRPHPRTARIDASQPQHAHVGSSGSQSRASSTTSSRAGVMAAASTDWRQATQPGSRTLRQRQRGAETHGITAACVHGDVALEAGGRLAAFGPRSRSCQRGRWWWAAGSYYCVSRRHAARSSRGRGLRVAAVHAAASLPLTGRSITAEDARRRVVWSLPDAALGVTYTLKMHCGCSPSIYVYTCADGSAAAGSSEPAGVHHGSCDSVSIYVPTDRRSEWWQTLASFRA
jgi:hypothetical protein